jgi:hypothetical protein
MDLHVETISGEKLTFYSSKEIFFLNLQNSKLHLHVESAFC